MASSNDESPQRYRIAGLTKPASLRLDPWGVPHIRAGSTHDLFLAQGFNAARDRLWQIDLWRKRGLGLLAGDFGPGYLMQDRAARLFLYRGDMAAEWANYGPDAQEICAAFVEGINAAVALIEAGELPLPPEFTHFGTFPARWRTEDVVRIRSHALSRNADSEVKRLRLLRLTDAIVDELRVPLAPPLTLEEWGPIPDVDLPPDVLDVYHLATAPVTFSAERLAAGLDDAPRWNHVDDSRAVVQSEGSNNWIVSGSRTASGLPIMASDPHRALGCPSLRYLVHLTAPGLDLIGAGEPSSPGIMAGHNGHSAFSLTIFPADQEDVQIHRLDHNGRYADGGGWAEVRVIREMVPVRGQRDQPVDLPFIRENPVVWQGDGVAVSIRTVATDPGTAPYMACLASMRAKTWDQFRAALAGWGAPSTNQIYADVTGTVGWTPAGFIPRRSGWRGMVPVTGDGGFAWDGFIPQAELPQILNPDAGYVQTANEMNLPSDWDHAERPVSHEWLNDGRAERIKSVLGGTRGHTVGDSLKLQTDTLSPIAEVIVPAIIGSSEPAQFLRHWDLFVAADSAPAALFELWLTRHLGPALVKLAAPDAELAGLLGNANPEMVAALMAGRCQHVADAIGLRDRHALMQQTLDAAWAEAHAVMGNDPFGWRWGDLHQARFAPATAAVDPGPMVGPLPVGGSSNTVMLTEYDPPGFRPLVGASVRMVVDLADWDASRWINAPGQSGDPESAHYGDLAPLWAEGEYVPMSYSEPAVQRVTVRTIELIPQQGD
ncbi:penicillin acylase family protein [Paracoccus pacificus]|uniref:Penicillin acylase family protein n=1 Tax=Paracoccus pacificus TaxID=1463598 RepID=A0ABW4R2W1_9RHOB